MEPWRHVVAEIQNDSSPPLYYLLLRLFSLALGAHPFGLRALSALSGVSSVYLCSRLGSHLFGRRTGLIASFLLSVSPLHLYYSREARPYAWFTLLVLASFILLERVVAKPSRGAAVAHGLVTAAAAYTHNYGLFLLGIPFIAVLARRLRPKLAFASAVTFMILYAPWLPSLVGQIRSGATDWVVRWWTETPPALALVKSVAAFCIGGRVPPYVLLEPPWLPGPTAAASYGLFAFCLLRAVKRQTGYLAAAMGVVLGAPFLLSFAKPIYLVGRQDVFALPLFFLLCARGLDSLTAGALRLALLATLVLAALSVGPTLLRPAARGVETQARLIVANASPGDPVLCTGFTRNTLEYYVRLEGGTQVFHSFPTSFGRHRGWLNERELSDLDHVKKDASELAATLASSLSRTPGDRRLLIAHSRLLREANDLLMERITAELEQTPCPAQAESLGFTCWMRKDRATTR